jgi:TRAP-type transport system small permease protein
LSFKASAGQPPQGGRPFRFDEALCAAAMALICVISLANVVVRYLTDVSFAFTEEYSVFLLVFMTLIGSAAAFATDGHIRIVFLRNLLPVRHQRLADALALLLSALLFTMVLYYGALFAFDEWQYEETSPGLGYPNWIYTVWLPLLCGWILVSIAGRLQRLFRHDGDA